MNSYNVIKVKIIFPVVDDKIYRTYSFEHINEETDESTAIGIMLEFAHLMNSIFGTYPTLSAIKNCYEMLDLDEWKKYKELLKEPNKSRTNIFSF